jgi:hypothetical protein
MVLRVSWGLDRRCQWTVYESWREDGLRCLLSG